MKNRKRFLSLALALVMALALVPTAALAVMDETVVVDVEDPAIDQPKPIDGFVRVTHAVSKETMACSNGETLDVYTVYPNAKVYRLGFNDCTDAGLRWYESTVENGVLQMGELTGEYFQDPPSDDCWLYNEEEDIGKYLVLEIFDSHFTKRIGLHIVAGSVPVGTPTLYFSDWGLSHGTTADAAEIMMRSYIENWEEGELIPRMANKVPVGTVFTPPHYRVADQWDWANMLRWPVGEVCDEDTGEKVEYFPYQGRQVAVVEPGYVYCCYNCGTYVDGLGYEHGVGFDAGYFFTADLDTPAVEAPAVPANLAYPSTQNMDLFLQDNRGWPGVRFYCYALKDETGNLTNYVKLRDLAAVMSSTVAKFDVGWDGNVVLTSGTAYTPVGGEGAKVFDGGNQVYTPATAQTIVNGVPMTLDAIVITDDNGGGHTYYKLRDLAQALNFNVGWDSGYGRGIFIQADKPYDPND